MPTKKWYQSRTVWIGVITGLAAIIAAFSTQYPDLSILLAAQSALMVVLRMMTTTQIQ